MINPSGITVPIYFDVFHYSTLTEENIEVEKSIGMELVIIRESYIIVSSPVKSAGQQT